MDDLQVNDRVVLPGWELYWTATRSSGAGGQHVNRTESCVVLQFSVPTSSALTPMQKERVLERLASRVTSEGVIQIRAEEHRSQHRNLEVARDRLAALLRDALHVARRRVPTRPSRGAKERRMQGKREVGEKKALRRKVGDD
jgi:ribosome-associated protein